MRKSLITTLAVLAALALASGASAQLPPPGQDLIGVYSNDFDGPTWANLNVASGMATVYLICSGVSATGVAGWEAQVYQDGTGAMFVSSVLQGQGPLNMLVPPEFMVGLGVPITESNIGIPNAYSLAELTYFISAATPVYLRVDRPVTFTSWPDDPGPGYADPEDVGNLIRFYATSGDLATPVFGFNTGPMDPPIAVQDETWGGIKGLFR
jgi:hypothetical protein